MKGKSIIILTIELFNNSDVLYNGVTKKILDQVASFKNIGLKVKYTGIFENQLYLFEETNNQQISYITGKAYKDRIKLYNYITETVNKDNAPNYVYIRHVGSDISLLRMMKHLKSCGTTIILEFPTYPYYAEKIHSVKGIIGLTLDILCNLNIKKYTTLTTNTNGFNRIYGTNSFSIENAVYIPRFKKYEKKDEKGKINLIAVSSMAKWHGYDRIIEGLRDYKENGDNQLQITLHLVGEGPEINFYKHLCKHYNLDDLVVFHGNVGGEKLDQLFDQCHIGLSSFGLYRIGLKQASTLKVREYCARGIPFVYAYDEQSLKGNEVFACKLSNDSSTINIWDIINFYRNLKEQKDITEKIREFAKSNFSWEDQFRKMFYIIHKNS